VEGSARWIRVRQLVSGFTFVLLFLSPSAPPGALLEHVYAISSSTGDIAAQAAVPFLALHQQPVGAHNSINVVDGSCV